MSWLQNEESEMVITCGDGKEYTPLWIRSTVEKDYNVSEFEFLEVSGTLVKRYKAKGARYMLNICFTGENNLSTVRDFLISADDERPWTIFHPLYGNIKGQPVRLTRNDTAANVTEISGPFVESIDEVKSSKLKISDYAKAILAKKESLDQIVGNRYFTGLVPSSKVITKLAAPSDVIRIQRSLLTSTYNTVKKRISNINNKISSTVEATTEFNEYFSLFTKANAALNSLTTLPIKAVRLITSVINAPSLFLNSVRNRVDTIKGSLVVLRASIENIGVNAADRVVKKIMFETNGTLAISSMATTAILQLDSVNGELTTTTPPEAQPQTPSLPEDDTPAGDTTQSTTVASSDYPSRDKVIEIMEELIDEYNQFIDDLDTLQSENGGDEDSYIPDYDSMKALSSLVDMTVSQLMDIALNSKQERIIYLEEDTNVILLTHRLYSLDQNDNNLNKLITTNEIGISELLQLRKGRRIRYYV